MSARQMIGKSALWAEDTAGLRLRDVTGAMPLRASRNVKEAGMQGTAGESLGAWGREPGEVSRGGTRKDCVCQAEGVPFIPKAVESVTSC